MNNSILRLALIGGAAIAVAGCASTGYGGYGYTGLSYGYSEPYYGWYDNYYYPGTGYFVYDRSGSRHRWSDRQRDYWQSHRGRHSHRGNWTGYHRDRDGDRHHRDWSGGGHHSRSHDRSGEHRSHGNGGGHDRAGGHRSHDGGHGRGGGHHSGDHQGHSRHH